MTELRVLNTRPACRAAGLHAALKAAGFAVDDLPLLELLPVAADPAGLAKIQALDRYELVFVVSPTAADLGLRLLADWWPQWPARQTWVAVGEATARILRREGLAPVVPRDETSEGVLALPEVAALGEGARALVLRGEGGRNLVRQWLSGRAVRVDDLDLYRRRMPPATPDAWQALRAVTRPDIVVLTSGEALRCWLQLAGDEAFEIPVAVVSARLAAHAADAGVRRVVTCRGAGDEAVVTALQAWRSGIGHGIHGAQE